jgi:hypothetical protein
MKRMFYAVALAVAASGAYAQQVSNVTVNGVFQTQVGSVNGQRLDAGSINTSNTNVRTNVRANQVMQLQGGSRNEQTLQLGAVLPGAPTGVALRTNVTVNGAVMQVQRGSDNTQFARIGVIH